MKVTLNWLRQYVDFTWSAEELAERLTMLGLEVERVQKLAGEFEGIVVAQILTREKVPGSDKLSVCRINDGKGERTIICGAQNHKPGDKVPLILPNYSLPLKPGEKEPFVIKERKVFGITSQGMMCSPRELGLADDAEGLLILPENATVGQPFAEFLGRSGSDVVYDLEVTPNRPDLNSVIGIAREIAAQTAQPLKLPEVPVASGPLSVVGEPTGTGVDGYVAVRVEEPEVCPRYTARVVTGVKVGPSPNWLRASLEKVGVRSINNVVDVTNYVMLEVGQPLHAFDYHLLTVEPSNRSTVHAAPAATIQRFNSSTPAIVVRRAAEGEKFTTLDGQERRLTNDMLLITDGHRGIALAGIMGGQNTEIRDDTRDVLIESAYFSPTNIRCTSKALGLRSESSYRFERGADIGITDWASRRCAQLILETAGGQLVPGVVDVCSQPIEPKEIRLRFAKTNDLFGIDVPVTQQRQLLTSLGLEVAGESDERSASFLVPTWRVDLKREIDLVEEIARLYGVEKIPSTTPRGTIGSNPADAVYDQISEARRMLTALGLNEAQGQTLVAHDECRSQEGELVRLNNPLSSDMDVLRPSLLPGLLRVLCHNISRKNYDVALFEIGRVFTHDRSADSFVREPKQSSQAADRRVGEPREQRRLAIALTGQRVSNFWSGSEREAKFDIYDLKGVLEEFLDQFGLRGVTYSRSATPLSLLVEPVTVQLGGRLALGEFGQLSPVLARRYDLRDAVFLAELDWDQLLARRNPARSFKPLPHFPAIRRDVAMLVAEGVTHEAVLTAVKQTKPANLESVEIFDVFRGKNVPAGEKSVAYAFTYRRPERTLTDAEVNEAHDKLVAQLRLTLHAQIRE
jgi:phenylalanyl-tRNA synthetase beta chain